MSEDELAAEVAALRDDVVEIKTLLATELKAIKNALGDILRVLEEKDES